MQKTEDNIWKQCAALLAFMQLFAVPYNRCKQQRVFCSSEDNHIAVYQSDINFD